jgi:predicted DNA-binding transcriptional regulator YafY
MHDNAGATTPKKARQTRAVIYRILMIHRMLESGSCPCVKEIAEKLEVSRRTIERDIELLRDQFSAPLEYDHFKRGYRYTRQYTLPSVRLTEGEVAVLIMGQRLLTETAGTIFAESARQVIEKLPLLLSDKVSIDMNAFMNPFSGEISFGALPVRGDEDVLTSHFRLLSEAIAKNHTVNMEYYTATRDVSSRRDYDPYHLRMEDGAWYVIGYCHTRKELRTLAVDRIRSLTVTDRVFKRPSDFSIDEYLGHSWGIERGKEYTVKVAFDPIQARWIRERQWHHNQKLTELDDGGVMLEVVVSGLESIKRWIMGFGSHARVLEPPELVSIIRKEAQGILNQEPE